MKSISSIEHDDDIINIKYNQEKSIIYLNETNNRKSLQNKIKKEETISLECCTQSDNLEIISSETYKKFLIKKILNEKIPQELQGLKVVKKYRSLDLVTNVVKMYKQYNILKKPIYTNPENKTERLNINQINDLKNKDLCYRKGSKTKMHIFRELYQSSQINDDYSKIKVKEEDTHLDQERLRLRKSEMKKFVSANFYSNNLNKS